MVFLSVAVNLSHIQSERRCKRGINVIAHQVQKAKKHQRNAERGKAWRGQARQDEARQGQIRQGKAKQGTVSG